MESIEKTKTFTEIRVNVDKGLAKKFKAEAKKEHRKQSEQFAKILDERYQPKGD